MVLTTGKMLHDLRSLT